jgi:hypothetical protein
MPTLRTPLRTLALTLALAALAALPRTDLQPLLAALGRGPFPP